MEFFGESAEYWAVLLGSAIYVWKSSKGTNLYSRAATVAAAALLGVGLSSDIAKMTNIPESFVLGLIIVFSDVLLEFATAFLRDREVLIDIIRQRLGGKP